MSQRIITGDCRAVLATLPACSVQCVVTSPPYFGLRDYGTATWVGGDAGCDHLRGKLVSAKSTLRLDGREHLGPYDGEKTVTAGMPFADVCGKCGARRVDSQIGLEASPDAYVAEMVAVFRDVRRVLRDDGVVFLNLGDSYVSNGRYDAAYEAKKQRGGIHADDAEKYAAYDPRPAARALGIKPKDLLGIPWMVAFALRADGWWLRSDIIWAKPNPMPESVTDRPTSAHEHVFLLSKRERYFYDADAVAEPSEYPDDDRKARSAVTDKRMPSAMVAGIRPGSATYPTRNLRNVWTIATQPYSGAHFATMPPALAEICIKAGSSERGQCPHCGAPWARVLGEAVPTGGRGAGNGFVLPERVSVGARGDETPWTPTSRTTTGWSPTCACPEHTPVPQTVLDPFGGAGTTGLVADRLNRDAILIELNPAYATMARNRLTDDCPLFADVALSAPRTPALTEAAA